jgi:predicted flap endonuclease-1-like 5' DNA nuclease
MDSSNNWLLFILILIIIVILVWALLRNRPKQSDLPTQHAPEKSEPGSEVEGIMEVSTELAENEPISETIIADSESSKSLTVEIPDDLEIIEGIGPKIAKLLQEAGISTFAQLAQADISNLRSILFSANLRVNDPTSWPEQAKLAAAGKMDELKQLQDQLKGGRV